MTSWQVALIVKPFILILYLLPGAIVAHLVRKKMKDGKLKRLLLRRIN